MEGRVGVVALLKGSAPASGAGTQVKAMEGRVTKKTVATLKGWHRAVGGSLGVGPAGSSLSSPSQAEVRMQPVAVTEPNGCI